MFTAPYVRNVYKHLELENLPFISLIPPPKKKKRKKKDLHTHKTVFFFLSL